MTEANAVIAVLCIGVAMAIGTVVVVAGFARWPRTLGRTL